MLHGKRIPEGIFSTSLVSSGLNILSKARVFESVAFFDLLNSDLQSFKFTFQLISLLTRVIFLLSTYNLPLKGDVRWNSKCSSERGASKQESITSSD